MILAGAHHVSSDGVGGVQFISDLCQVYDNLYAGREWDFGLRKLDLGLLADRGRWGVLKRSYLKHIWKQPIAVLGMLNFLTRSFKLFHPQTPSLSPTTNMPGITGAWINPSETEAIKSFCDRCNTRVNSLAMAAVFYATQQWLHNANPIDDRSGKPKKMRWVRMLLPVSYRNKSDLRLPMTNKTTIVQIDRNSDQMKNRQSFLHYLNREIEIVIGWQFDKFFLMAIVLMSLWPRWLERAATTKQAQGTIVFTNLGEPFRLKKVAQRGWVGPLAWEDFDLVGPLRPEMPVNFTLQRYQDRYRMSLHFDRRVITPTQAQAFLKMIKTTLNQMTQ
jgi:hypothetical protein